MDKTAGTGLAEGPAMTEARAEDGEAVGAARAVPGVPRPMANTTRVLAKTNTLERAIRTGSRRRGPRSLAKSLTTTAKSLETWFK